MRFINLLFLLSFFSLKTFSSENIKYAKLVNPFIGTGGHGHTFPGACAPFGMVQLSPDTRIDGSWDGCSGYHYSDTKIYGFSHTHLNGTGVPDYGDVSLMPTNDEIKFEPEQYAASFSHKKESAEAAYYKVHLEENNIDVELTSSTRAGFHRYTYNENKKGLILDLNHRDELTEGEISKINETTLVGYRFSKGWARNQKIFFVIKFSQKISEIIFLNENGEQRNQHQLSSKKTLKAFLKFNSDNRELLVKVGISAVGLEGAEKNLDKEIKKWDFEKTKLESQLAWEKELSKIEITTKNPEEEKIFYTALYHTMIQPNVFSDVDGSYRGMDDKVHVNKKHTQYTVFSLWDTFRGAHPLYTLLDRKRSNDFIETFLNIYQQGGKLPVWELAGNETNCMIGYHSVSVMADALAKNINNFNIQMALEAAVKSANANTPSTLTLNKYACISVEDDNESVSKTLEYAYDNWCIAQMAKMNKNEDVYKEFAKKSMYYKNIIDPKDGFAKPKVNGNWIKDFDPKEVNNHFTEANSWQYSFFVPQDIQGLINFTGGAEKFENRLDSLFTISSKTTGREQSDITGLIGQYAHGNEPSHHMAYLYNYINQSSKSQEIVNKICKEFYKNSPDGLIGNEDCGQMSAWYILSSLGLYQVCPGDPNFDIGSPLFDAAIVHLENGKEIVIKKEAKNEESIYIQSLKVNGKDYKNSKISYADLMQGMELNFQLSNIKNNKALQYDGKSLEETGKEYYIVCNPTIEAARVFENKSRFSISQTQPNVKQYFSLKSDNPDSINAEFQKSLGIGKSATIFALSKDINGIKSGVSKALMNKRPNNYSITYKCNLKPPYNSENTIGLVDGIYGDKNWRMGNWQGFQGEDFEAIVDLKKSTLIQDIKINFLQDTRAWIIYPKEIFVSFSEDGINFSKEESILNKIEAENLKVDIQKIQFNNLNVQGKFIKIKAINYGDLPKWHDGKGENAYIFLDEIEIN